MRNHLWQYVLKCDPFARSRDVIDIKEINEWDILICFVDGRKVLYDRYTNYYKNISYENISILSDEQERTEFAYRLRSLMGRNSITQEQLSDEINITQAMVSRYVRGEAMPSALVLRKMAKVIGCSMDDFFPGQF